jgi:hypothetical protein
LIEHRHESVHPSAHESDWHHGQKQDITWNIVKDNTDKPWNWGGSKHEPEYYMGLGISLNPNITWDFISDNPDKPWNWYHLIMNPKITWDVVKENLDMLWCWYNISKKPSITKTKKALVLV